MEEVGQIEENGGLKLVKWEQASGWEQIDDAYPKTALTCGSPVRRCWLLDVPKDHLSTSSASSFGAGISDGTARST